MNPDLETLNRLSPLPQISREDFMACLSRIHLDLTVALEAAYVSGVIGPDSRMEIRGVLYHIQSVRSELMKEDSLESKLEASIEMVRERKACEENGRG